MSRVWRPQIRGLDVFGTGRIQGDKPNVDEKQRPMLAPAQPVTPELTPEGVNALLEKVYEQGGNYEGPIPGFPPPSARIGKFPTAGPKVKHPRVRVGPFPNDAPRVGEGCGAYGMHRTRVGLDTAVKRLLRALRPIADEFDALYVTGQSGICPGAVVAWKMQKEIMILRKKVNGMWEDSHGARVEGSAFDHHPRYVIVDDFVSHAGTMENLIENRPTLGKLVAVALYGQPRTDGELRTGYMKAWASRTWRDCHLRLVRRGPRSILFDLVREAGWWMSP